MAPHQPHLALLHRTAEEHGLAQGRSQRWVGKILPLLPGSLSGLSCSGGDSSLAPARRTFPPEQPSGSQLGPATSLGSREYETHQVCAGQGPAWGGSPRVPVGRPRARPRFGSTVAGRQLSLAHRGAGPLGNPRLNTISRCLRSPRFPWQRQWQ